MAVIVVENFPLFRIANVVIMEISDYLMHDSIGTSYIYKVKLVLQYT